MLLQEYVLALVVMWVQCVLSGDILASNYSKVSHSGTAYSSTSVKIGPSHVDAPYDTNMSVVIGVQPKGEPTKGSFVVYAKSVTEGVANKSSEGDLPITEARMSSGNTKFKSALGYLTQDMEYYRGPVYTAPERNNPSYDSSHPPSSILRQHSSKINSEQSGSQPSFLTANYSRNGQGNVHTAPETFQPKEATQGEGSNRNDLDKQPHFLKLPQDSYNGPDSYHTTTPASSKSPPLPPRGIYQSEPQKENYKAPIVNYQPQKPKEFVIQHMDQYQIPSSTEFYKSTMLNYQPPDPNEPYKGHLDAYQRQRPKDIYEPQMGAYHYAKVKESMKAPEHTQKPPKPKDSLTPSSDIYQSPESEASAEILQPPKPKDSFEPTMDIYHAKKPEDSSEPTMDIYHAKKPEGSFEPTIDTYHAKKPEDSFEPTMDIYHAKKPEGSFEPNMDIYHAKKPEDSFEPTMDIYHAKKPKDSFQPTMDSYHAKKPEGSFEPTMDIYHAKKPEDSLTPPIDMYKHPKSEDSFTQHMDTYKPSKPLDILTPPVDMYEHPKLKDSFKPHTDIYQPPKQKYDFKGAMEFYQPFPAKETHKPLVLSPEEFYKPSMEAQKLSKYENKMPSPSEPLEDLSQSPPLTHGKNHDMPSSSHTMNMDDDTSLDYDPSSYVQKENSHGHAHNNSHEYVHHAEHLHAPEHDDHFHEYDHLAEHVHAPEHAHSHKYASHDYSYFYLQPPPPPNHSNGAPPPPPKELNGVRPEPPEDMLEAPPPLGSMPPPARETNGALAPPPKETQEAPPPTSKEPYGSSHHLLYGAPLYLPKEAYAAPPPPSKYEYGVHDFEHPYDFPPHPPMTIPPPPPPKRKPYAYYHIGRKLYLIPAYFGFLFIPFVLALIIRSIIRHKVNAPFKYWASGRKNDLDANETERRVARALEAAEKRYK